MAKIRYEWGYLGAFLIGLAWELYAIFDGNPNTWALTTWIVTYIPWWLFYPLLLAVFVWLVKHFKEHYNRSSTIKK